MPRVCREGEEVSFWQKIQNWCLGGELAVIHEFHKPPYGGGNQFLLAVSNELEKRGVQVSKNRVGSRTRVLLVNSFNFDFEKVKKYKNKNLRIIHRVDGPVSVYRSLPDSAIDKRISDWNLEMADATIMQSRYSLEMHERLGISFRAPEIIPNAVSGEYFFPRKNRTPSKKIKIAGTSWSTNPKKGLALYHWLDNNLDFSRYELSFMGRIDGAFKNVITLPASATAEVGNFLRDQDIYFMPSENECCSNALIEALSSGLPAVYKNSGSSPELVKEAGSSFETVEEVPALLDRMAANLADYRSRIRVLSIAEVSEQYSRILNLSGTGKK